MRQPLASREMPTSYVNRGGSSAPLSATVPNFHFRSDGPVLRVGDRVRVTGRPGDRIVTVKDISVSESHSTWPTYRSGCQSVPWGCVKKGEHVCIDIEEHAGGIMGWQISPVEAEEVAS